MRLWMLLCLLWYVSWTDTVEAAATRRKSTCPNGAHSFGLLCVPDSKDISKRCKKFGGTCYGKRCCKKTTTCKRVKPYVCNNKFARIRCILNRGFCYKNKICCGKRRNQTCPNGANSLGLLCVPDITDIQKRCKSFGGTCYGKRCCKRTTTCKRVKPYVCNNKFARIHCIRNNGVCNKNKMCCRKLKG